MDFQSSPSSSSSSSSCPSSSKGSWKYDVALSYCSGQDTCPFGELLLSALDEEGLRTSRNCYDPFKNIKESQIYMVVFSDSYAASTYCLKQLAMIFECMNVPGHSFLPIFFKVNPSDVKRWLDPCKTLLNQRPDLVLQHRKDLEGIIRETVVEAKKMLSNEKDTFSMDFQWSPSSSSKWIWPWSCDVFLSFNNDDTRSFVEELSYTLNRNGFTTASWDSIARGPLDKYKIYVVIFSENYSASICYLQELAAIAAVILSSSRHKFLPVFFNVDPNQILNSCFLKRMQQLGLDIDKIVTLLTHGQDLIVQYQRDQRQVIGKIVDETINILDPWGNWISLDYIDKIAKAIDKSAEIAKVGIGYHRVEKLERLLDLGSNDVVRSVGICGIWGIGKTALSGDVFNKISHHFDSAFFLTDLGKYNFVILQAVLPRITFQEEYVHHVDNIEGSLRHHKMLIVFDDVDDWTLLYRCLVRKCDSFGGGSRIIITTRDRQVLKELGVDEVHMMEPLNENEALQLFCRIVFKSDYPMRGYEELVLEALKYGDGLPLLIKSLGLLLRDRSVSEWQSELAKLQMIPDSSVLKVLGKSFNQLGYFEKKIFLDIACCFAGEEIDYVKEILISHYGLFMAELSISILIDKSLINISEQKIKMHFMLQQWGKENVRQESLEPGERSRIWNYKDFRHIMETNTGTENVQLVVLPNQGYSQGTSLNIEGLSKMSGLKALIFHDMKFSGCLNSLSNDLSYFLWHKYPFTDLPSSFKPNFLRELILPNSCITQLWRDKQVHAFVLRTLNLRGSKNLKETPDFTFIDHLERVDFEGCTSLLLLPPSIASLEFLSYLNLRNCKSLISIPNELFHKNSVKFLNLAGCSQFAECLSFNKRLKALPPLLVKR